MVDATEPVDALRSPNDNESRFLRGIVDPFAIEFGADTWRGTREDVVWGEARTELRAVLDAETCPFSKTPNSFIDSLPAVGEAPREDVRPLDDPMIMLALRLVPFALSVGELTAEDLLEIRGIFVGVSLDKTVDKLRDESGGPSFASRTTA